MTRKLFWEDAYMKECDASVTSVEGNSIVLDRTCFNPRGGGLVSDRGSIADNPVVEVAKKGDDIIHLLSGPTHISTGEVVKCTIDWEHRYRIMRMHTATHILSNVVNREAGALITGNSVSADESRVDFNLDSFDKLRFEAYIDHVNETISRDLAVRTYFLKREEALKLEGMVKLAEAMPPQVAELRIVEIGDFDRQADGGVHVAKTSEVGAIRLLRAENKGKLNRRVYFTLK